MIPGDFSQEVGGIGRVRLGITGGIGSGKSYICRMLSEQFGVPVYNCDIWAAIILRSDAEVIERLYSLIDGVYDEAGALDKVLLSQYMFSTEEHLRQVNGIVHPAVRKHLREWQGHFGDCLVAVESAILYESGFDTEVDYVLFVDAPLELRLQRAVARDGIPEEQILRRMAHQHTEAARQNADFIVCNDGRELQPLLASIIQQLNHKIK